MSHQTTKQKANAERQADESAGSIIRHQGIDGKTFSLPNPPSLADERADQSTIPGVGTALSVLAREQFEEGFNHDFGDVRIHTDAGAAQIAEVHNAEAITVGNDIIFARGRYQSSAPDGRELLAHELTHVVQQARPGVTPTMQRNPDPVGGIGRRPPDAYFIPMNSVGAEDDHILFERNDVALDATDMQCIRLLIGATTEPVTIHVHGYASEEGDEQYNYNLSAHRAVAAQQFIETLVPEGSRVIAFAHGRTGNFGELSDNRRVGISIIRPQENLTLNNIGPRLQLDPAIQREFLELRLYADLLQLFPSSPQTDPAAESAETEAPHEQQQEEENLERRVEDNLEEQLGQRSQQEAQSREESGEEEEMEEDVPVHGPLVHGPPTVDYSGIAPHYAYRTLPFPLRDVDNAQEHFLTWYNNFNYIGLPSNISETLANVGTGVAFGTQLSLESPTRFEALDRQLGTEPTFFPIVNDAMIRWLLQRRQRRRNE